MLLALVMENSFFYSKTMACSDTPLAMLTQNGGFKKEGKSVWRGADLHLWTPENVPRAVLCDLYSLEATKMCSVKVSDLRTGLESVGELPKVMAIKWHGQLSGLVLSDPTVKWFYHWVIYFPLLVWWNPIWWHNNSNEEEMSVVGSDLDLEYLGGGGSQIDALHKIHIVS